MPATGMTSARLAKRRKGPKKSGLAAARAASKRADEKETRDKARRDAKLKEQQGGRATVTVHKAESQVYGEWKLEDGSIVTKPPVEPKLEQRGNDVDIIGHFKDRGKLKASGAAYHEPADLEMKWEPKPGEEKFKNTTFMGLSYQIASLMTINTVEETYAAVLDLNVMYKITDSDKPHYEAYRAKGNLEFQDLTDDIAIKVKPPIFEFRNALSEPEQTSMRVTTITRGLEPHTNRWSWYATLYAQIRIQCYESFEMERFPFTRNSLQIHMQVKQGFNDVVLVPYNHPRAMPLWVYWGGEVKEKPLRPNIYKCDTTTCNWIVENHHVAFVPFAHLPPTPPGNKFSLAIITMQCTQNSKFYLWNTVPVIMPLPVIAILGTFVPETEMALRMGLVLALLLTMAAFKVAIIEWVPQKSYLTFMDYYIISGFVSVLLMGACMGGTSFLTYDGIDVPNNWDRIFYILEQWITGTLAVCWTLVHLLGYIFRDRFYNPWDDIYKAENDKLIDLCSDVSKERKAIMDCKFNPGDKPPSDEPAPAPEEI